MINTKNRVVFILILLENSWLLEIMMSLKRLWTPLKVNHRELSNSMNLSPQQAVGNYLVKGLSGWSPLGKKPSSIYLCDAINKPQEIFYLLQISQPLIK